MENVEDVRMMLLAVAFITDVHVTCSYRNVNHASQSETSWRSWHKKVLGVVLFLASAHMRTNQRKARRGPGNIVRASLSLHFRRQFVYPWFVHWFVILQGIKTDGVRDCDTCPVEHRTLWGRAWVIRVFSLPPQTVCLPSCCLQCTPASYNRSHV